MLLVRVCCCKISVQRKERVSFQRNLLSIPLASYCSSGNPPVKSTWHQSRLAFRRRCSPSPARRLGLAGSGERGGCSCACGGEAAVLSAGCWRGERLRARGCGRRRGGVVARGCTRGLTQRSWRRRLRAGCVLLRARCRWTAVSAV